MGIFVTKDLGDFFSTHTPRYLALSLIRGLAGAIRPKLPSQTVSSFPPAICQFLWRIALRVATCCKAQKRVKPMSSPKRLR